MMFGVLASLRQTVSRSVASRLMRRRWLQTQADLACLDGWSLLVLQRSLFGCCCCSDPPGLSRLSLGSEHVGSLERRLNLN